MKTLLILFVIACIFLLWRLDVLSSRLMAANVDNAHLSNELVKSRNQVAAIIAARKLNEANVINYYQRLDNTVNALEQRERELTRLKHENKQLRDWVNAPVPDAIGSVRNRPAVNSASDYRQWLSGSHPVPVSAN